jgi:predicted enzyme related to lactoylglutathione lyase
VKILEQCFRVYAEAHAIDATIAFYEALQGATCARRVTIAETGVVAAKVGGVLILAGQADTLAAAREVHGIYYVDDLDAFADWVRREGGEMVHRPRIVTSGRNFTARHPDGLVMEYFQPGGA